MSEPSPAAAVPGSAAAVQSNADDTQHVVRAMNERETASTLARVDR